MGPLGRPSHGIRAQLILRLAALPLVFPTSAFSGDWPQFHFSEARTGFNAVESTLSRANISTLTLSWRTTISAAPVSPPVVADGKVFVGSNDGNAYALDGTTGLILWSGPTGASIPFSPAVDQGRVYVGSDDTKVYAFSETCSTPCSPLWTATTAGRISSAPAVAGGVVYVGAGRGADGDLWALDAVTGSVLWTAPLSSAPHGVAVADGVVYADFFAFPASCSTPCSPLWVGNNGGDSMPAVSGGVVYVDAGYVNNRFNAYPASCSTPCSPLWVGLTDSNSVTAPAIARGMVYLEEFSGVLAAFPVTCSTPCAPRWTAAVSGSSPAVAKGVVYVGSGDGQVHMFDATTGAGLWSIDVGDPASSPAVANGAVYVSSYRGLFTDDLGKVSAFTVPTWYVSPTGNDANDCKSPISACATIQAAIGKAAAGDTIKVATGTYTSTGLQVVVIDKALVVLGGWNASFTAQDGAASVDGQSSRRGMAVGGVTATVERFVFENGTPPSFGGGGILNNGTLTLNNSTIRNNSGGGIRNMGSLTVNESTISGNSNNSGGGGIENFDSSLTLNTSTISGNTSTSEGAGINNSGGSFSSATLTNSTISANAAAFRGGGVANKINNTVTLRNTIVAGNTGPFGPDCWRDTTAAINSQGHNLIGNTLFCNYVPGAGDLTNRNAMLGPLQDNGGPTLTHALLLSSPAIDAGDTAACPPVDQRGVLRPQGSACDIGAYELQPVATAFFPLPPCRAADTRFAEGPALAANAGRDFAAAGRCGIPSDAVAVAIIITTVQQTDFGDLRLYRAGGVVPSASTINFAVNHVRANNAIIPLGVGGQIGVQCDMPPGSTGTTHFIMDTYGYFK
jgi:outer membrane protein assembly factor BamB